MNDRIICWHFVADKLRDGSPVPAVGEVLSVEGRIACCPSPADGEAGLHGSRRIIDALSHAPGSTICKVEIWGDVVEEGDKLAGRHRRIVQMIDGEGLLREFARRQALSVGHLWDMPEIVREYLETGREDIRAAARGAAWAAWDAAGAAAGAAARAAAWDAAEDAAGAAARAAAWDAAEDAARDAANAMLTEMVERAMKESGE
jgi:hypothetical protein